MANIGYGHVSEVEPDFDNARIVSSRPFGDHYSEIKFINNVDLCSDNKKTPGFSKVGFNKKTEQWNIVQVWAWW